MDPTPIGQEAAPRKTVAAAVTALAVAAVAEEAKEAPRAPPEGAVGTKPAEAELSRIDDRQAGHTSDGPLLGTTDVRNQVFKQLT